MPEDDLSSVEDNFVHQVYDAISGHFSATRFAVWPKVREFIEAIPTGAIVADVGCGNGKYFAVRDDWAIIGSDRSKGLAEVSRARIMSDAAPTSSRIALSHADVLVADGMMLPYRPGAFDAALCIAVLHHITSRERRIQMLRELLLILRPGGRALVTVWATQQEEPHKTIHKWQPLHSPSQAFAVGSATNASVPCKPNAADQAATHLQSLDLQHDDTPTVPSIQGTQHEQSTVSKASMATNTSSSPDSDAHAAAGSRTPGSGSSESCTAAPGSAVQGAIASGADYLVPWHLPFHRAGGIKLPGEGEEGSNTHVEIDSKKGAVVFKRYYHLFDEGELDELVEALGPSAKLVNSYYDKSNWCVVFEKVREG